MSNTFTALCLHEHYFESPESAWTIASDAVRASCGSVEWRDRVEDYARAIDAAWSIVTLEEDRCGDCFFDAIGCFDFAVVPAIAERLAGLLQGFHTPSVETVAQMLRDLLADAQRGAAR